MIIRSAASASRSRCWRIQSRQSRPTSIFVEPSLRWSVSVTSFNDGAFPAAVVESNPKRESYSTWPRTATSGAAPNNRRQRGVSMTLNVLPVCADNKQPWHARQDSRENCCDNAQS